MRSVLLLTLLSVGISWGRAPLASASSGELKVLTYNVAGLPDGFSTDHPSRNMGLIGQHFAGYDLVLVQEDFAYSAALRQALTLPHQSAPFVRGSRLNFGDGLSQFAIGDFAELHREPWQACYGIVDSYLDCLTPKGFTVSRQTLAPGVSIDVYNVHLDAGGGPGDRAAREEQIEQLSLAIQHGSAGSAVLLAGDTNIRSGQRSLLQRLEQRTGLADVCGAMHCAEPQRIDRIFVRDSARFHWGVRSWSIDQRFVDAAGQPLSDHLAVAAELAWSTSDAPATR
jgi:endonuclease/exonuclease/phosphatase family metal-dependent hydrolase